MGNCYEACHASFEDTLEMVAGNRQLTVEQVVGLLASIKTSYAGQDEYETLRRRLPTAFPF